MTFTADDLVDRGMLLVLRVPHLPLLWPRCPDCYEKLERLSDLGVCDWRCGGVQMGCEHREEEPAVPPPPDLKNWLKKETSE